jgi:hypothetical protein
MVDKHCILGFEIFTPSLFITPGLIEDKIFIIQPLLGQIQN